MYNKFGSLWHQWDLHIHTDASDGKGTCQEILNEAEAKKKFRVLQLLIIIDALTAAYALSLPLRIICMMSETN